jgi:hypothetical protein
MVKRVIRALSIAVAFMAVAGPASAKVIPTDTEVAVDGQTAIITVDVESHGGPGEDLSDELEMMVGLYPVEALDESGRPHVGTLSTPMEFQSVDADTYRAVVELPEAGEWAVIPFPLDPMMPSDMYPTVSFTVTQQGLPLIAVVGLVVAVLLAAAVITRVVTTLRPAKPVPATGTGRA